MRFADSLFENFYLLLDRLKGRCSKVSQIISAVKTFITAKFDYLFLNVMVPVTKMNLMNKKIRRVIKGMIGASVA
jgi:hypothetical protein